MHTLLSAIPSSDGWDLFAKVKVSPQLVKEVNEYFLIPVFDSKIKFYEGKEMTFEGDYMPLDLENGHTIVLSKNPYAQCVSCGGAGSESVAEVSVLTQPPKFKVDQIVRVTGILKLNDKDIDPMNFILTDAKPETR